MLELIILLVSVGYLGRFAASRGKSKVRWTIVSIVSYVAGAFGAQCVVAIAIHAPRGAHSYRSNWLVGAGLLAHLAGGLVTLLFVYMFLRRQPQLALVAPASDTTLLGAAVPSRPCSKCRHGETRSMKETWCSAHARIVSWMDSCDRFEPKAVTPPSVPDV